MIKDPSRGCRSCLIPSSQSHLALFAFGVYFPPACLFLFMSYFSEEVRFIQKSTGQEGAVGDCSLPQVPQASSLPRGPLAAESPGIFQPQ